MPIRNPEGEPSRSGPPPGVPSEEPERADEVVRQFVEHWGMMARAWGINATMGELFALLYISGTDWTADALREWLHVSRGNVSMNLRELIAWGVVHKVHRPRERREFYRAEGNVWTLFRRILSERKRRELDPTLIVLERTAQKIQGDPSQLDLEARITALRRFFEMINALASRLMTLESGDWDELLHLFPEVDRPPAPADKNRQNHASVPFPDRREPHTTTRVGLKPPESLDS